MTTGHMGQNHKHFERIRNLKLTHSLSIAPLYLLFKDHKGWSFDMGTPPPSRPVCSAGAGQDDHLSEIISHILEPIVKMRPGGLEVNSTVDFISIIDDINNKDFPIEDINLEEIDRHLEEQEKEAQKKYDEFDNKMDELGSDKTIPEG